MYKKTNESEPPYQFGDNLLYFVLTSSILLYEKDPFHLNIFATFLALGLLEK